MMEQQQITAQAVATITDIANSVASESPCIQDNEVTLYINADNDTVIVQDGDTITCHDGELTVSEINSGVQENTVTVSAPSSVTPKHTPKDNTTSDFANVLNLHQKNQNQTKAKVVTDTSGIEETKMMSVSQALRQEISMHVQRNQDHDMIVSALKMNISLYEKRMKDQEEIIAVTKQKYETQVKALEDKVTDLHSKISDLKHENEVLKKVVAKNPSLTSQAFKFGSPVVLSGSNTPAKRKLPQTPKATESTPASSTASGNDAESEQGEDGTPSGTGSLKKRRKWSKKDDEDDFDDGIDDGVTYEVVEGGSQRGKRKLTNNEGYTYTVKRQNSATNVTNWICSFRSKNYRCPASVSQKGNKFRRGQFPHNHDAKPDSGIATKLRAEIKSRYKTTSQCVMLPNLETPGNMVKEVLDNQTGEEQWQDKSRQLKNLRRFASRFKQKLASQFDDVKTTANVHVQIGDELKSEHTQILYASEEQIAVLKALFPEQAVSPTKRKNDG